MAPSCIAEPEGQATDIATNETVVPDVNESKPYRNNELKHVLKKFLVAMAMVGGSCLALYFILSTYKRVKSQNQPEPQSIDVSKNLTTPDNIEEATKLFIEKF